MEDEFLVHDGEQIAMRLFAKDGMVTVERARATGYDMISLLIPVVLATIAILGGAAAVVGLLWVAAVQPSPLACFVSLVFAVALLPAVCSWLYFHGALFSFKATLGKGRYRLANGFLRVSLRLKDGNHRVVIYPTTSHGAWGYRAVVVVWRMRLRFPLMPACVIGTRKKALDGAINLREFLRRNITTGQVMLSNWGEEVG